MMTGRMLDQLSHAELVDLCKGLILDCARLNGQLARWEEIGRSVDQKFIAACGIEDR